MRADIINSNPIRRVLVLVDREYPGANGDAGEVISAVTEAEVLVVAITGPVPNEGWIIDRTARERQATRHLESWIDALTPHAVRIAGETGDENPRLAVADARHAFHPDAVIVTGSTAGIEARSARAPAGGRRWLGRLRAPALAAR